MVIAIVAAMLIRHRSQRRQQAVSGVLDAADALEERLRTARAEIEAVAGSDADPVRDALRDMLRQRLWLKEHAGTATLDELAIVTGSLDAARRRIDQQLEQIERARALPLSLRSVPRLILASTSPYRRELLQRLRLPFEVVSPAVDEVARPNEGPVALATRLARAKALVISARESDAWVIGSDQVAECDGVGLGKPGHRGAAIGQLRAMSGRDVRFLTSVCIARGGEQHEALDETVVRFRVLDDDEIARYVDAEQPYDCAGSFKSEGLGIALFDAIESSDPTALIGLPLIALGRLLRGVGFTLP